jgi:hypothetical protein
VSKPDLSIFENMQDQTQTERHWQNMPEFNQQNKTATRQIIVSFDDEQAVREFARKLGIKLTAKTKSIWFPERQRNSVKELFWSSDEFSDN